MSQKIVKGVSLEMSDELFAETLEEITVAEYLKHNGLWDAFAAVALKKEMPTVGEVHQSSAPKKKPQKGAISPAAPDEDDGLEKYLIEKRITAEDRKGWDVDFAKLDASLYVMRPLLPGSAKRLEEWAKAQGIQNVVPADLMHVTQVHSAEKVSGLKPKVDTLTAAKDGRFVSPLGDKNALVVFLRVPEMVDRFKEAKAAGAKWSFPYYRPHVTVSYDAGDAIDWTMIDPPDFDIMLGPEAFSGNDDSWVERNGLRKGDNTFELTLDVTKALPDQQMVFGWASISTINGEHVIDKQGDIIPVEEIEKAAYEFVLYSREQGHMHTRVGVGKMIESMVFTAEKAAFGLIAKNEKGESIEGWFVGFKVTDAGVWADHRAGKLPEFSIGGRAASSEV